MGPTVQALTGGRWHLSHGPIDIIMKATGQETMVEAATRAAIARFPAILPELAAELPVLRRAVTPDGEPPRSPVGARMWAAAAPHYPAFVTSMAAVAGAVAEDLLDTMLQAAPGLHAVYVNDGGDIALFCAPGAELTIGVAGVAEDRATPGYLSGQAPSAPAPVPGLRGPTASFGPGRHGIATSGARGRSFSLGIADAVTVVADTAAAADVAATLIANAVTLNDPSIERRPARDLDPDSDLGDRLVTVFVPPLSSMAIDLALDAGVATARGMIDAGLIRGALLSLQGHMREAPSRATSALLSRE